MSGLGWTALSRWAAQVLSWIAMAYAARALTPSDFGLAGMAMLAIGLARMVEDLGLDAVIVQDRSLRRDEIARLGGLATLFGFALASLFALLAVPVARFFDEPAVAGLVAVLGLAFITDALQIVPRALLQRELAFRRLAWINFLQLAALAGALAGFVWLGYSYWALILNTLVGGVVAVLLLNLMRPHPLAWPSGLRSLARPIAFGTRMIISRIAWYGYNNADSTIAGKALGKQALGAYQLSLSIGSIPLAEITSLVSRVIPGIFSDVQKEQSSLLRYCLAITEAVAIVTTPMYAGLALVAEDAVPVLLGPQWSESIAPLRILCLYFALNSLSILVSHVLVWTGRVRANMWLNLLSLAVIPACLYIGSRQGLSGMAWAWVVAFPLANLPAYYIVFRIIGLTMTMLVKLLLPVMVATATMTACVLALSAALPEHWDHAPRLAVLSVSGAVIYAAIAWLVYGVRMRELYGLLRAPAT